VHTAHLLDPLHSVGPQFLNHPFPDGQIHGSGVEDRKESLIRHEFDHPDDEEKAEKDSDPTLIALEIQRDPSEEEVFHVRGRHEEDEGGAEPLFEVVLQFFLHLGDAHALFHDESEDRDRNQPHQNSGERFQERAKNGPADEVSEHGKRMRKETVKEKSRKGTAI
jgi:hypothetical protein